MTASGTQRPVSRRKPIELLTTKIRRQSANSRHSKTKNDRQLSRAKDYDVEIEVKIIRGYTTGLVDRLYALETQIFDEPYSREKINRECSVKPNLTTLIALSEEKDIGYKVGYEMTSRMFYSWMGGVVQSSRKTGVARKLMAEQHKLARSDGYSVVRTYTENQYRDMLLLNIRSGLEVIGTMNDSGKAKTIIILDKRL